MKPLEGVRVLDLTRLLPGAYATLLLADLGADVAKIEDPRGGDPMRQMPAARDYFDRLNRGKRSVSLDLRSPQAVGVLDALAARADALVESFRPSTARRLGVDAAALRSRHPHLVCASISGFGQDGPYVERAAHDINYQALAGLLHPPQLPGPLVGDIGAATQAALGIVAALLQRARTGEAATVDVSIHEAALAWSMFPTTTALTGARYNVYETADGQWLALGALEPKFWSGFCERVGLPTTASMDDVQRVIRTRGREAWLAHFADLDVCLTTVYTPQDVLSDPHLTARGVVPPETRSAPALGADTDSVLEDAGIDAVRRSALRASGVI
jgi:alpha-methylacyl-CoA racemase